MNVGVLDSGRRLQWKTRAFSLVQFIICFPDLLGLAPTFYDVIIRFLMTATISIELFKRAANTTVFISTFIPFLGNPRLSFEHFCPILCGFRSFFELLNPILNNKIIQ